MTTGTKFQLDNFLDTKMKFIIKSFLFWQVIIIISTFLAIKFVPLQNNFLGGGMESYLNSPFLWSRANFDGEHFLAIAQFGYQPLTYFFFPFYPLLIKLLGNSVVTALLISHFCFLITLLGFYKLIQLDFSEKIAKLSLIMLLIFPTSFYFGMVYSESLFLALSIWAFYLIRKNNFFIAGILIALASITRLIGVALFIPFFYEFWISRKKSLRNFMGFLISPLGLITYLIYLKITTGDYLNFFNTVSVFGEQRSTSIILLPQVFYRYFFKVLPNLNLSHFPSFFPAVLETLTAIIFLIIIIFGYKKLRISYWIYLLIGYLIPTLSGSFSSLPRYVLILFPAYIYLSQFLIKRPILRFIFFGVSLLTMMVSCALFVRGYFIS